MTIERIGQPDPISRYGKTEKASRAKQGERSDAIEVSAEARSKAEVYNATELARNAPDIRWELVQRVKEKLEDPNYLTREVLEKVADGVMETLTGRVAPEQE
jgi:anti-sigma28 factor (negative regulator of flagellin synthesis)